MLKLLHLLLLTILFFSCANPVTKAVNKAKYSAYEMVGLEKRDLFRREVKKVKNEQEDTGEAFKDALTQLKEIYGFEGGDLEKQYSKLKGPFDDAQGQASEVKGRVAQVQQVVTDLFTEWESEIKQIKSSELRSKSRKQLSKTRRHYQQFAEQLKKSEKQMEPVLSRLNDQVLFMKHNLNAKAIAGLKTEGLKIEKDIERLIDEVNRSSKEAEELIKAL